MRLSSAACEALTSRIAAHPLDVDAQLMRIGHCAATRRRNDRSRQEADALILRLIEELPRLVIDQFWMVGAESGDRAKDLWEVAFGRDGSAVVYANAAWSLLEADPSFSRRAYSRGEEAPGVDSVWFCEKAGFYDLQVMTSESVQREEVARMALQSILQAIEREERPARRHWLLWPARQYAHAANERDCTKLLRAADAAWKNRGRQGDRQRDLTVLGLVALARDDDVRARGLLAESARHLQAGNVPTFALANALAQRGHLESVRDFFRACLGANVAGRERVAEWASQLDRGVVPELSELEGHSTG